MTLTESGLQNPHAVAVGVAIVVLFGGLSIARLPVQLFPDIDRPMMSIETTWRAASPREVESEIIEPQEDVLKGLPGLHAMWSGAGEGSAFITLEFTLGTDMTETLIEVISRLNRVAFLPDDAEPPLIDVGPGRRGGNEQKSLSWFFVQTLPGNDTPIQSYVPFLHDVVRPRIEAVPGVASVFVTELQQNELRITFDPFRAADLGIGVGDVARLAGRANDISGGFVDVGRRQYTVRFAGRYKPEDLSELILDWRDGKPVLLGDIADISVQLSDRRGFSYQNGHPALGIRVDRQPDSNLLDALEGVKAEVAKLREGILKDNGLTIEQSFDASVFIYRAITLVTNNLAIGALLAIGILWWFLRRMRATLIIALAIPCSLLATFVVLNLTGRSLNVISLAGLAFASGMVVDAAIVVLENIVRLRSLGRSRVDAAREGATQVWGALLASTSTTVAIFLPVIFIQDVEGQLFSDLALTVAISVTISLLIATVVIPAAAVQWLPDEALTDRHGSTWDRVAANIVRLSDSRARRIAWIAGLMIVPVTITVLIFPDTDYLPPVKRDSVDAFFNLPAGQTVDGIDREIAQPLIERLQPFLDGEREPAVKNYFILLFGTFGGRLGVRARDQSQVLELERVMREEIVTGFPDMMVFIQQSNLFGNFDGGRAIAIHLQAGDQEALLEAARQALPRVQAALPRAQVRPQPTLELAQPELRLVPRDRELIEAGWSRMTFGPVIRSLVDGLYIGEYFDGDERMDIILRATDWHTPEEFATIPLATPSGQIMQVGQLVDVQRTVGPSQISRLDGRRTISLIVVVPEDVSLEDTIQYIKEEIEPELLALMPSDGSIQYGGSAQDLANAITTMGVNFLMALLLLFLLMAALFRSMRDSLLVMMCIPLACVGSVILIQVLNLITFQPLDLLTMIGFIILMGLVVNNAILLVHQTRASERQGLDRRSAVHQALRIRTRPILMSTLTSIFGMLPLLLMPGEGSVIYRGLAAAIVGGMSVSTLFTMVLLPCLLRLGETAAQADATEHPVQAAK